jgi:hypothetical protein
MYLLSISRRYPITTKQLFSCTEKESSLCKEKINDQRLTHKEQSLKFSLPTSWIFGSGRKSPRLHRGKMPAWQSKFNYPISMASKILCGLNAKRSIKSGIHGFGVWQILLLFTAWLHKQVNSDNRSSDCWDKILHILNCNLLDCNLKLTFLKSSLKFHWNISI